MLFYMGFSKRLFYFTLTVNIIKNIFVNLQLVMMSKLALFVFVTNLIVISLTGQQFKRTKISLTEKIKLIVENLP